MSIMIAIEKVKTNGWLNVWTQSDSQTVIQSIHKEELIPWGLKKMI